MSTLHTIKLHGFLGDKYAKSVTLAGANMFQVMRGLIHRFGPEFKEDVRSADWHVLLGNRRAKKDLGEDDLGRFINDRVIHLIPAVAGGSGAVRTILGAALVVVGVITQQPWLVNVGAALAIGGVVEMLTKPVLGQPGRDDANNEASYIYNGPVNVTEQGVPVPLIFGRVGRCSSVIIASDFSNEEVL